MGGTGINRFPCSRDETGHAMKQMEVGSDLIYDGSCDLLLVDTIYAK